jgi:2-keto-4-pentenoate hydratase/2-oxohepta-3-ene-1,7-dioic acid hydratase in catechol pathway
MRLAAFTHNGTPLIGLAEESPSGTVVKPARGLSEQGLSLREVIAGGEESLAALRQEAETAEAMPLDAIKLTAPIPRPGKVLAIGLNYRAHVAETGREVPPHQIWFNKQRTCICGPFDVIDKPVASDMVDYEGELVVVIGRRCRHVPADRAHEVIAGYMVGNDVSVRDWQKRTQTMQMGKSFDTHGPTGPWIVTADEIDDPQALTITTTVSGVQRQHSTTGAMIHAIRQQIEHLTTAFTLEPGDLIFTGTPEGVGMAMDPPLFLKDGDTVRIEISGIGTIENPVANEVARTVIG